MLALFNCGKGDAAKSIVVKNAGVEVDTGVGACHRFLQAPDTPKVHGWSRGRSASAGQHG